MAAALPALAAGREPKRIRRGQVAAQPHPAVRTGFVRVGGQGRVPPSLSGTSFHLAQLPPLKGDTVLTDNEPKRVKQDPWTASRSYFADDSIDELVDRAALAGQRIICLVEIYSLK
jgi:hypothetical protein